MPNLSPEQSQFLQIAVFILIIAVALIDSGILLVWAFTQDAVNAGRRHPIFARKWSLVHVWFTAQAVVTGVLIYAVVAMVVLMIKSGGVDAGKEMDSILMDVTLWSTIPQNLLFIALPALIIVYYYRKPLSEIGLKWLPSFKQICLGILFGFGIIILGSVSQIVVGHLAKAILSNSAYQAIDSLTSNIGNEKFIAEILKKPDKFLLLLFGGGVLAPFGEEFFFRGFLYNALRKRWRVWPAVLVSAFIFALIHAGPLLILAIFPIGVALALAYEYTGSLWVPIIMHITNNSVQFIAAYYGWIK